VHAIGYVSAINEQDLKAIDSDEYAGTSLIGKLGVEAAYEHQLHGKRGSREFLVNAAGRPVDKQGDYTPHFDARPPVAGDDLILGMDIRVQKVAEDALAGKRGSVVAIDPKTGDVIAMASLPGFDPNGFVRGLSVAEYGALRDDIDIPLLNRALRGAYPPGSTVKPLYALAAQKYNILSPLQPEFCGGFFILPGNANKYRDDKKHGFLNMRQAIARVLRRLFLPRGREAWHRPHGRFHEDLRLRLIDRHRHSRGKSPACTHRRNGNAMRSNAKQTKYGFPAKPSAWASARDRSR
jgi:penicillin-binding protein 2